MCDCLDRWTTWLRAGGAAANTVRIRTGAARRAAAHAGTPPCQLTTEQLVSWLDRPLAAATRASYYASIREWSRWLQGSGLRGDDPTAALPKVRAPRGVPRPVSESSFARLMLACDPRERVMVCLAAYAGLRVHEIAKVRGEDIDADALYVEGKGGVRAMIPTHPRLWEAAQAAGMPASGPWFPSRFGHLDNMRPVPISRLLSRAMRRAGVPGSPHALRHRYGTAVLRSSGGNLRVAQELLRHASPATTAIYTLVEDHEKRAAIYAIA